MGLSEMVVFTCALPGDRKDQLWSLGLLARALGVDGFIRGRCVRSRSPLVYFGSSCVVWFTCAHPGGRWVDPGSLGFLARA